MSDNRNCAKLATQMKAGLVYKRQFLKAYSKAIDRDLMTLVRQGVVEKVGAGLYCKPTQSRFGKLPPKDHDLVQQFLQESCFLMYSWSDYNSLGLGLTQLYNRMIVYNRKRHGIFELAGKKFDFRRPARGFPKKSSVEFLLVDLINNLNELTEDTTKIKSFIELKLCQIDLKKVKRYINQYGKVVTRKFFTEVGVI